MKKTITRAAGALLLTATLATAQTTVCEDFEGGSNPGWTAGPFGAPVTYEVAGGNPNGRLNALDNGNNPEWYSPSSGIYTSNYRDQGLSKISVDLREETGNQFTLWIVLVHDPDPMVSFDESFAYTVNNAGALSPPAGGGWFTYEFDVPSTSTTAPTNGGLGNPGDWGFFGTSVTGTNDDKWNFYMTGGTTSVSFHVANNPVFGFDLLGIPWDYSIDNVCFTLDIVGTDVCNGDGGDGLGCTDCPCANNAPSGTIGGCLNSAGTSSRIAVSGNPSVSLPAGDTTDLRFTMSGGPATATSVLLSGDAVAPTNMANPCFGLNSGAQAADRDGLRCAVSNVLRHGNRQTNASGEIMDPTGPSRVWGGEAQPNDGIAGQGGFVSGQTRYYQVIHRDSALSICLTGLNSSQAVGVTFLP